MSNKEKIKELEDKCANLREEIYKMRDEITALELEGCNYEGKYILLAEYGYMYVTWQKIDRKSIYGDERMFLQGYLFKGGISPYTDDFWFSGDAMEDLWIPLSTFMNYVNENKIKEITREEFIDEHNKMLKEYSHNFSDMLNAVEYNYKNKNS